MSRGALIVPEAEVRDADLLAELEAARGSPGFTFKRMKLAYVQAERDQLERMSPGERRRRIARAKLDDAPDRDALRHIHSVLAICALPLTRQALEVRSYERRQGRMSLVVHAGQLKSPQGETVMQPLPYGSRARLLMLHLCSEAVRQGSPTIHIEDSLSAFIRAMGFPVTGGANGTLNAFKAQLTALAACRLQIGMWDGTRARNINAVPFSELDVWMPTDPDQRMLWPSTVTFSLDFFASLQAHALPVNVEAVRAFAGSARKLDLMFWLGYRLHTLRKPLVVSWAALQEQFGEGFARERAFRAQLGDELNQISELFPKLPAKLDDNGLTIAPAGPEVLSLPALKLRKG